MNGKETNLPARTALIIALALGLVTVFATRVPAADDASSDAGTIDKESAARAFPAKPPYSPYAGRNFPTRPYFGDSHTHTSFSMDGGAFGCRLGPRDAYRFGKGQEVVASSGQRAKLSRPLGFIVVSDHSDGFGFFPLILAGDPKIMADPQGRKWNEMINSGKGAEAALDIIVNFGKGTISKAIFPVPGTSAYRSARLETIAAADEADDPGRFTAFIGFEWTSNTGGNNLHRSVIFRENGDKARLTEPFTTMKPLGSDNPRDLWKWMATCEEKTGSEILALAHNGNLSNGIMFPITESFTGKRIDRAYAEARMRLGKTSSSEPGPDRATHPFMKSPTGAVIMGWEQTSSGYAAVWAAENTRAALFDAMKRRETYATTGPRMVVRFFGGFDFEAKGARDRMPARLGYTRGVPMGGDLPAAPAGRAPTFLVAALKDPIGANLDRYQIVKGWLDAKGQVHEKVCDVAWSGDRKPGADGKLPSVGNTVDVKNATGTNTIGAPELIAVWRDPAFDPAQRAFYYGRVIEIPTPRWTAYDARYFGIELPKNVPMTTTERAYTSPIWYTPAKR